MYNLNNPIIFKEILSVFNILSIKSIKFYCVVDYFSFLQNCPDKRKNGEHAVAQFILLKLP